MGRGFDAVRFWADFTDANAKPVEHGLLIDFEYCTNCHSHRIGFSADSTIEVIGKHTGGEYGYDSEKDSRDAGFDYSHEAHIGAKDKTIYW